MAATELHLKLPRFFQNKNKTLGNLELWHDDELLLRLRTIELPWLNNEVGKSCIIAKKYRARIHQSPNHGWSLWIHNVPGRTEILVHIANYVRRLKGCVAPGLYHRDIDRDGIIDVANSGDAMKILEIYLQDLEWIDIEITDPPTVKNWVEKNKYIPNALKKLLSL